MTPVETLLEVMKRLRAPETGCPWDREQTFTSLAPYTIEEAYEVLDAVQRGDTAGLRAEVGDLLFQVVFFARIGEESGCFDFNDVVAGITDKLVRRHPHVFGDARIGDAQAQAVAWEAHKADERRRNGETGAGSPGGLAGVTRALPALIRAVKLQDRAALVGFDWPDVERVLDKVMEEIAELREELAAADAGRLEHEVGDILLAVSNVARHLGVDPEMALHRANRRFERRYAGMEALIAAQGRQMQDATLEELETLWQEAKQLTDEK